MKKLLSTSTMILSLTMLVILFFSPACKPSVTPPTPPPPTTYTVSYDANGGTGSTASSAAVTAGTSVILAANGFTYVGYTFTGWNTASNGSGTSYAAGASYTVSANVTLYAQWQKNAPTYTAVFTATDLSLTEVLKSLPGFSANRAIKLNVTTGGTALLADIGVLTNGNPAVGYYWLISKDSVNCSSTLNPLIAPTVMAASQTITLPLGTVIICFKTAAFSGAIANGTQVGLKITGANSNSISNASFTADASHNAASIVKINCKFANGKTDLPGQSTGDVWSILQITPYNDQSATVYDGTLYPSISSVSFDTKSTTWFTGTFNNYSSLDFTNALGTIGRNLKMSQIDGTVTPAVQRDIFINSQAVLSSGIITFSGTAVKMLKSNGGNYAYCSTYANVYNSDSSNFGSANVSWWLKGVTDADNAEKWIYAPDGVTRIY